MRIGFGQAREDDIAVVILLSISCMNKQARCKALQIAAGLEEIGALVPRYLRLEPLIGID